MIEPPARLARIIGKPGRIGRALIATQPALADHATRNGSSGADRAAGRIIGAHLVADRAGKMRFLPGRQSRPKRIGTSILTPDPIPDICISSKFQFALTGGP